MAQNYKVRLKRWNGTDFDTLNLSSLNVLMSSGENIENEINSKTSIDDSSTNTTNAWSGQKINNTINSSKPRIVSFTLGTSWSGSGPYTQNVTITGITTKTKIDIQPDTNLITNMMNNGVYGLYILNNNGSAVAYAVGGKTTTSYNVKASLVEVQ